MDTIAYQEPYNINANQYYYIKHILSTLQAVF